MEARIIDLDKDLNIIAKWWKDFDGTEINSRVFSDTGVMVSVDEENICAGWLFETNSECCMIGWFVANQEADKNLIDEGLRFLTKRIETLARKRGYGIIMTYSENKSMIKRLTSLDYMEGDIHITQLIKGL